VNNILDSPSSNYTCWHDLMEQALQRYALIKHVTNDHEQHTLHLDAVFHNFIQGDLSVNEYCRKFKAMADGLADLGAPVEDRILVLNILWGLNQCFEHVGSIIRLYSPFLNFLKVRDSHG
jgi:hypothetical protein